MSFDDILEKVGYRVLYHANLNYEVLAPDGTQIGVTRGLQDAKTVAHQHYQQRENKETWHEQAKLVDTLEAQLARYKSQLVALGYEINARRDECVEADTWRNEMLCELNATNARLRAQLEAQRQRMIQIAQDRDELRDACVGKDYELAARAEILERAVKQAQTLGFEHNGWIDSLDYLANLAIDSQAYKELVNKCRTALNLADGESLLDRVSALTAERDARTQVLRMAVMNAEYLIGELSMAIEMALPKVAHKTAKMYLQKALEKYQEWSKKS